MTRKKHTPSNTLKDDTKTSIDYISYVSDTSVPKGTPHYKESETMSDKKEIKPYKNKGTCLPLETDDMTAILNMTIEKSIQRCGHPSTYPQTKQGLDSFINNTIDYFEYVNGINQNIDLERKLIPDIENWCVFLGITRQTLFNYEGRGGEWKDCIAYYKNAIASVKKQLAMNYKIPPMVYVFDATNNHHYVNSNEFKLNATTEIIDHRPNILEQEIQYRGLIWNEERQEFEGADN